MFDSRAFHSLPQILLGAGLFAVLFGFMMAMGEALLGGAFAPTRVSLGFAAGAFAGYIGVALIVRRESDRD